MLSLHFFHACVYGEVSRQVSNFLFTYLATTVATPFLLMCMYVSVCLSTSFSSRTTKFRAVKFDEHNVYLEISPYISAPVDSSRDYIVTAWNARMHFEWDVFSLKRTFVGFASTSGLVEIWRRSYSSYSLFVNSIWNCLKKIASASTVRAGWFGMLFHLLIASSHFILYGVVLFG